MKKMYAKYKILVNGLNTISEYKIDGFTLKKAYFDQEYFNIKRDKLENGMNINTKLIMWQCLSNLDTLQYNYLESDDFIEFEIPDEAKIDADNAHIVLERNKKINGIIADLESKIRLLLNIPVLFQIVYIEIYNENKDYKFFIQIVKHISSWNRLTYNLDEKTFSNNSRFHIDFNCMKQTENNQFNRALKFYNDSFESDEISTRYILIFSCLESIFNLDSKKIKEKLACYSAKLLSEDNINTYNQIYQDIKNLYKKRCDYIHGLETNNIEDSDEKLLRFYTRKIIIAYWIIILYTKKTAKEILRYLDSDEKLDIQIRMIITALNAEDFSSQQHKLVDLVEGEFGSIPDNTKNSILKNCKKDNKMVNK